MNGEEDDLQVVECKGVPSNGYWRPKRWRGCIWFTKEAPPAAAFKVWLKYLSGLPQLSEFGGSGKIPTASPTGKLFFDTESLVKEFSTASTKTPPQLPSERGPIVTSTGSWTYWYPRDLIRHLDRLQMWWLSLSQASPEISTTEAISYGKLLISGKEVRWEGKILPSIDVDLAVLKKLAQKKGDPCCYEELFHNQPAQHRTKVMEKLRAFLKPTLMYIPYPKRQSYCLAEAADEPERNEKMGKGRGRKKNSL